MSGDAIDQMPLTPFIVVVSPPTIYQTKHGDMDEDNAAKYLSYRMCRAISARTLRHWRMKRVGPPFHSGDGGRPIWYRLPDIDEWLEITCAVDPLAA